MKALVFGVRPEPFAALDLADGTANPLTQNLARTPTALQQVPARNCRIRIG